MLLPTDLIGYCKSLIATLFFAANVYFWRDTNYFSTAAEQKPLLHLWSLGVEEQFYVIFPLIILVLARRWPRSALSVIAGLTLTSLTLNISALFVGGDGPAFFLLPTRAWELGLGALLPLFPQHSRISRIEPNALALTGAILVLLSLAHPFGSLVHLPEALPIAAGTSLIILAGTQKNSGLNRALTFRSLVFTGLISYSLYLWHWPVIVFAEYYLVRHLNTPETIAALIFMTICASLSWHFVERPFRDKKTSTPTVCYAAAGSATLLGAIAVALIFLQGLPQRLSPEAAMINAAVGSNYRCPVTDYVSVGLSRGCLMNPGLRAPQDADAILLGNSYAQMYSPLWASILDGRGLTGLLIPVSGCLPTVQANVSRECIDVARRNLAEVIKLHRARIVVLGPTWWFNADELVDATGRALDNGGSRALSAALDELIAQLQSNGKKVLLIGPIAPPGWDFASTLSRQLTFGRQIDHPTFLPQADFMGRFGPALRHFEARQDIAFVRPDLVQCHNGRCDYLIDGRSFFADSSHIAVAELPRFRTVFEDALAATLAMR